MIKSLILWSCVVFVLAYIAKYVVDLGVFRHIETTGLDRCRLMVPSNGEGQAFEDFTIDYEKGIAYLPGDNRTWWHTLSIPIANENKQGKVFTFDITSEKFKKLDLINYPYEHFHPLGVGLLKRKNNQLFMTNHRIENSEVIGSVEIFEIDSSNENQLKWIDSIVDPLFTVPDDVLPIDEQTFYVSNVYHYRVDKSFFLHTWETFSKRPWTDLILCSKTTKWQCKQIIGSVPAANGVAASLDFKTIYLASSAERSIRVYERHTETNALTYIKSLYVPCYVDNLIVDDHDRLLVAGHPQPLKLFLHEENRRQHRAPSEVVIFPHPKSNSTYETLLLTNGEILSASTVAGIYKHKLLVGALCDHGILLCENLF